TAARFQTVRPAQMDSTIPVHSTANSPSYCNTPPDPAAFSSWSASPMEAPAADIVPISPALSVQDYIGRQVLPRHRNPALRRTLQREHWDFPHTYSPVPNSYPHPVHLQLVPLRSGECLSDI